ncbi:MAG TPA: elongation factor G [Armatimonadota bacterium]|jgi:elongation factor G
MKHFETAQIRNIALIGHGHSGKTSLAEAMMFQTGAIGRLGRVDTGTTLSDSDPDEIHRKVSIGTSLLPVYFQGVKLNILDTPGYADFYGEVVGALHVADAALVVVDAVNGVEVQTERYWRLAEARALPRVLLINKLDKDNASFEDTLATLKKRFGSGVVAVQMPIGEQAKFRGLIDLVRMKAFIETDDTSVPQWSEIPAELQARADELRAGVMEAAAEADDDLTLKYLDTGELSDEEIIRGLREAICGGRVFPVCVGSGYKNYGTAPLLEMLANNLPSPDQVAPVLATKGEQEISLPALPAGPLAVYVFKTTADPFAGRISFLRVYSGTLAPASEAFNSQRSAKERIGNLFVMIGKQQDAVERAVAGDIVQVAKLHETTTTETLSNSHDRLQIAPPVYPEPMLNFSISPVNKGEEDKLAQGMHRFVEEDPTLRFEQDAETHEAIVAGMGELHLEVTRDRLKRKFNVDTVLGNPTVAYRETIRLAAEGHGRHKKQTGGAGQFGDAKLRIEPLSRGAGFEFVDAVVGGVVPRQYIPSVEKGVRETLKRGPLAGFPIVDLRCTLFDGSYHPVDSKDIAFQSAGRLGFLEAMGKAQPMLLEPYVNVVVVVPDEFIGDIIGGISSKRGRVQGSESLGGGSSVVKAQVPQAEMFQYSNELRALTQGRGSFSMTLSHYEEVPPHVADAVSAAAKKRAEEER